MFFHVSQIMRFLGIGNGLTNNSDYSRLTGKREVFVDSFVHQALLEFQVVRPPSVGTKKPSSKSPSPDSFICNRPFVYIIYEKMVKKILNVGIFRVATANARPSLTWGTATIFQIINTVEWRTMNGVILYS